MWVYDSNTDELYHYGRKGMKWGQNIFGNVKMAAGKFGTAVSKARAKRIEKKKNRLEAEEKARRAKITNHKRLTDSELKERIARMKMEKDYMDLMRDTDSGKRGKEFVTDVLESIGKNIFTQVGNHYGAKLANKLIGEDVIFSNNKKK